MGYGRIPPSAIVRSPRGRRSEMPTYAIEYGEGDEVKRQTLEGVTLEREDGWVTVFRGRDSILRVREEHVQSIEEVR